MAKILVVDDDMFIRDVYAEVLQAEKYDVAVAVDGEQALKMIEDGGFDLVLLDVMLPKMDGITVLAQVKQNPKVANVPIIMLTNFGQSDLVDKATKMGATEYLLKYAFTPGEVVEKVKKILEPNQSIA